MLSATSFPPLVKVCPLYTLFSLDFTGVFALVMWHKEAIQKKTLSSIQGSSGAPVGANCSAAHSVKARQLCTLSAWDWEGFLVWCTKEIWKSRQIKSGQSQSDCLLNASSHFTTCFTEVRYRREEIKGHGPAKYTCLKCLLCRIWALRGS